MLKIDPTLRGWIVENADRGCTLDSMVEAMVTAGHQRDHARQCVAQVVAERIAGGGSETQPAGTGTLVEAGHDTQAAIGEDARALAARRAQYTPFVVPDPLPPTPGVDGTPRTVDIDGHRVDVLAVLKAPRIIVFGNVFSHAECDELIETSRSKLERSKVVDPATGENADHALRTSEGTYFYLNETPFIGRLDRRIARLIRWPVENGEGLQILHYGVGGEYRPHYDYFNPHDAGSKPHLARGGNRVATLVIYLADCPLGGATIFPDIGFEVAPVKGNAVFFSYDVPDPASLTLHGGAPVGRGDKWIATKWLRERKYAQ